MYKNIIDGLKKNFALDSSTTFDLKVNPGHALELSISMFGDGSGKFKIPGWMFAYFKLESCTISGTDNSTKEQLDVSYLIDYILINRFSKEVIKDIILNYINNGNLIEPTPTVPAGNDGILTGPVQGVPLLALPAGDYQFDLTLLGFPCLLPFDKILTELKDKRKKLEFNFVMDDKHFDLALAKVLLLRTDYEKFIDLSDDSKRNYHTLALFLIGTLVKQNEGVDLPKLFLSSKK